jgi:hypothetical protein
VTSTLAEVQPPHHGSNHAVLKRPQEQALQNAGVRKETRMKTSPRPADVSSARARTRDATTQPSFSESRPDADRIAQRAYQRYEARGREDGHDMDDWFEAERELQGVSSDSTYADDRDADSDEAA